MAKLKPHDTDYEVEVEVDPLTEDEATTARLDLLSAYSMVGRLQLDGLLPYSVAAKIEETAPIVEPPACEDDGYYYREPGEIWTAA